MAAYNRITLASLVSRLTDRVGGSGPFWDDAEKRDAINEALCAWQALTGEFTQTLGQLAVPLDGTSVSFFLVPGQIASLQRVSWNGSPLTLVSLFELDQGFPSWQNTAGTPLYWAPVGLSVFAAYPAPTSGSFLLEGLTEAVRLAADSDFVDLGDEEITRLLDYAHHVATFKEGTGEFQASQGALKRLFEAAALRNARFKRTNTYRRAMGISKDDLQQPPRSAEGDATGVRA